MLVNVRADRGARRAQPRLSHLVALGAIVVMVVSALAACGTAKKHGHQTTPVPNPSVTSNPSPSTGFAYGIDWNFAATMTNNMDQAFSDIAATGATWTRPAIPWAQEEPSQGSYNWSLLDTYIQEAHKYHIQLIVQMGPTPSWDLPADASGNRAPPADCQNGGTCQAAYTYVKAFAAEVSRQNGWDVVRYIIPRNEPYYTPLNWEGGSASDYAQFVHAVYQATRDSGSPLKVMPGGIEKYPVTDHGGPGHAFIDALFSNPTFCKSIDVLDVHLGYWGPAHSQQVVAQSEQALQSCNGGSAVPVWVTELALESDAGVQSNGQHAAVLGSAYTGGAQAQAQFLSATYASLAGTPNLIGINWTALVDAPPGADTGASSTTLGLMDAQFNPKPAYGALTSYIKQHGNG